MGLDEAGRGPLAGPVTAAAVMLAPDFDTKGFEKVNDSKKISLRTRERLYEALISNSKVTYKISWTGPAVIDRINILEATKRTMKRCVRGAEKEAGRKADLLYIDGNFTLDLAREQRPVRGGDGRVFSCACASILAKVFRDRSMRRYHHLFPEYGFDRHKGYPTAGHRSAVKKYGPCRIHRRSFKLT